jgi:hypothetical protein
MSPRGTLSVAPHGLVGQTYDGDNIGVIVEQDDYKTYDHTTTTYAMGEGAIEGVGSDYEMASKFATSFLFSRFGLTEAKARNISQLEGKRFSVSGSPRAAGVA